MTTPVSTASSTRWTTSSILTPSSRSPTPAGSTPASEQPDLKATWKLTVEGPSHWIVDIQLDDPRARRTCARVSAGGVPPPNRSRPTSRRWSQSCTTWCATCTSASHGDYPTRRVLPQVVAQYLDVEDIFIITAGFEFFERNFEMPRVRQVRPALFCPGVHAGAMENARLCHLPRGLHLPLAGD